MKLYKLTLALFLGVSSLISCGDKLDLTNPNLQTTGTFGNTADDLEECVIAAYNHTRMEGSYGRVGYTIDLTRGDEVWNSSQIWYLPFDDFTVPATDDICTWIWREWYYTINVCNFILSRTGDDNAALSEKMKRIKGQALFIRGLSYYNLAGYYQTPPVITNYENYSSLDGLYGANNTYDEVFDQVEKDFSEAMTLLPSRDEGGEWAKGRATCGAAAGFYARALMMRHKYSEALAVLKDIIDKKYGTYQLMANYGDNFREGSAYENNAESLYEVQFLDYGSQGTDEEWTPVNTSPNATQGHAVESNFCPIDFSGWADLSASPWLYNLFKAERTKDGSLDPRLYWTIGSYEPEWEGFENGNVCYTNKITVNDTLRTNDINGGIPIAKWTNMRTNLYNSVVNGLRCGINLRLMRYSDVLLRAAECENEISGPTAQAIEWINQVRRRANLSDLSLGDFSGDKDKLFEQIANVERPKEFGCEFGRGFDLIRWGFFYNEGRLQQMKEHAVALRNPGKYNKKFPDVVPIPPTAPVSYADMATNPQIKSSFDTYSKGQEFLPIALGITNANPNLTGNSADHVEAFDNALWFSQQGWTVHPVKDLSK